jgi:hypothetical protein
MQTTECVWTNARELVPPHDFCAAKLITQNEQTYMECSKKSEAECLKDCNWYKGKGDKPNTDDNSNNGDNSNTGGDSKPDENSNTDGTKPEDTSKTCVP